MVGQACSILQKPRNLLQVFLLSMWFQGPPPLLESPVCSHGEVWDSSQLSPDTWALWWLDPEACPTCLKRGICPLLVSRGLRMNVRANVHLILSRRKRRKYCGSSIRSKSALKARTIWWHSRTCRIPPLYPKMPTTNSWLDPLPRKRVSIGEEGVRLGHQTKCSNKKKEDG